MRYVFNFMCYESVDVNCKNVNSVNVVYECKWCEYLKDSPRCKLPVIQVNHPVYAENQSFRIGMDV